MPRPDATPSQADRAPRAADVARAAGVSTATVSRTFNAPDKVALPIRERVLAAAAALGWIPHAAGSALARRRSFIAGAVIPTLDNEVFAAQVGAIQATLAEAGVTLLLGCSDYDPKRAFAQVQAMLSRGVEALAIVGEAQEPGLFELIAARRVPYVVTYSHRPGSPHPCIGFDNRQAFRRIADFLLDLGHREIGLILQPVAGNDRVAARLAGVTEALAERGLGLRPRHVREGPWSIAFGRTSLRAILDSGAPRPTAIVCGNDQLAIGALLEARRMGIAVPRDLSLTGFDDVALAAETDPPLTTMRVDNAEIGRRAARYLLARLDGQTPAPPPPLLPLLIERGSTAPPATADRSAA